MKGYLGLGLLFKGVDKGLTKGLSDVARGMGAAATEVEKLGEAADGKGKKGGIFGGLAEGLKLFSIGKIASTLDDIRETMTGKEGSLDDTFKKLDTTFTKVNQVIDPKRANAFRSAMMNAVKDGLSGDEAEIFAMQMTEAGASIEDTTKALPTMTKLVTHLGLEASQVAQMFGQGMNFLNATPEQMKELAGETAKMQKAFGLTDMFQSLPEVINSVTENAARFGKIAPEAALDTTKSVMGLVGAFQKYGKTQKEATAAAVGFNNKLNDMKRSIFDMQAGLAPMDESIFDAASAMTMLGMSGEEAMDMLLKGADDPKAFAQQMQGMLAGADDATRNAVSARLRRIFGDDVTNLMDTYGEETSAALGKADEAMAQMGDPADQFGKLTGAMEGTMDVQTRLTEGAKTFFDLTVAFANKGDYIKALQAQRTAYLDMATAISDSDSALRKFLLTMDLFKKFGLTALFGEGAAKLGLLLGKFGEFLPILLQFLGIVKAILPILGSTFSMFLRMAGFLWGVFGPAIMWIASTIGSLLISTLTGLASMIMGAVMTAMGALWGAIVSLGTAIMATPIGWIIAGIVALGAAVYLAIKYWDDIKAAVGGFFSFLGEMLKPVSDMIFDAFTKPIDAIKAYWQGMVSFITGIWDQVTAIFEKAMPVISKITEFGSKLFKEVGAFFGGKGDPASQADKGKTATAPFVMPDSQTMAAGAAQAQAIATARQPEAPQSSASMKELTPSQKFGVKDKNTLALIESVKEMQDVLETAIMTLAERPVNVAMQGDARKFFKAANAQSMNQAGQLGLAGAVTR